MPDYPFNAGAASFRTPRQAWTVPSIDPQVQQIIDELLKRQRERPQMPTELPTMPSGPKGFWSRFGDAVNPFSEGGEGRQRQYAQSVQQYQLQRQAALDANQAEKDRIDLNIRGQEAGNKQADRNTLFNDVMPVVNPDIKRGYQANLAGVGGTVPYNEAATNAERAANTTRDATNLDTAANIAANGPTGLPVQSLSALSPHPGQGGSIGRGIMTALSQRPDVTFKTDEDIRQSKQSYHPPQGAGSSMGGVTQMLNATDPKIIAQQIAEGKRSPITTDLGRYVGPAVATELGRMGVDVSKMESEWRSVQRFYLSKQSTQQLRIRQSADVIMQATDAIDALADEWKGGGFKLLNQAQMIAAQHGAMGPEAARIATQLQGQITEVQEAVANVYMGGNSPTDRAMILASSQLNANWSEPVLKSMTALARRNTQFRLNAIDSIGPSGVDPNSPYLMSKTEGAAQQQAGTPKIVTLAQLEALAKQSGTTVEQEKANATAAGYIIR
jgi:hypothetical protein